MKAWLKRFLLALLFFNIAGVSPAQDVTNRPPNWARKLEMAGVQNCYQVTTNLYRGAQPTAEGLQHLQALGIRTVISLRALHADQAGPAGHPLKLLQFKMEPWHSDEDEVVRFLKAATDTNNLPVFVHCERGADRTGTMCAMYRIVVCGWTKRQALDEMKNGGFGFNPVWQELVTFVERSDVAAIQRRVGLR